MGDCSQELSLEEFIALSSGYIGCDDHCGDEDDDSIHTPGGSLAVAEITHWERVAAHKNLVKDDELIKELENEPTMYTLGAYDGDYALPYSIPVPSARLVEKFTISDRDAKTSASKKRSKQVKDKFDINWSSLDDYLGNWEILPTEDKFRLRSLLLSNVCENANRFGLKDRNFESHMLQAIGCDMTNIINNGNDAIISNLRSHAASQYYQPGCLNSRTVDPKTCVRAYRKFMKENDVEAMFATHRLVAYQAVIVSDDSYRPLHRDVSVTREKYNGFFKGNAAYLAKLANKKRKIGPYCYSHEVSVDSIIEQRFRPHSHVIFMLPRPTGGMTLDDQRDDVAELVKDFNDNNLDRTMSVVTEDVRGDVPRIKAVTRYSEIERSFNYLFRAYSLAGQYMREVTDGNIRELNYATVQCYHTLIDLFSAEGGNRKKGVRRFNSSNFPSTDPAKPFKHPLLPKRKKSPTLKKGKSIQIRKVKQSHDTISIVKPESVTIHGPKQSIKRTRVQEGSSLARHDRTLCRRGSTRSTALAGEASIPSKTSRGYLHGPSSHRIGQDGLPDGAGRGVLPSVHRTRYSESRGLREGGVRGSPGDVGRIVRRAAQARSG